jgi:hypothetical protein
MFGALLVALFQRAFDHISYLVALFCLRTKLQKPRSNVQMNMCPST